MTHFCDSANSGVIKTEQHNAKADTMQNKVCGAASAWEVMRRHRDFKGFSVLA